MEMTSTPGTEMTEGSQRPEKYASVNGQWPAGSDEGRALKPSPQEAVEACRRLYRKFMGRSFKGRYKLTTGNRRTWIARHVFYVNPDERTAYYKFRGPTGGGWHEIVHSLSHLVSNRLHRENHGPRHAFIEKEMVRHVVESGWLDGALRKPERPTKPQPDARAVRLARIEDRMKAWQTKARRADTALRKLRRQRARYLKLGINHKPGMVADAA